MQNLALGFADHCAVPIGPPIKPIKFPLDGIPLLKPISCTTHLGVILRHAEGALNPTVYVTDEDTEQLIKKLNTKMFTV